MAGCREARQTRPVRNTRALIWPMEKVLVRSRLLLLGMVLFVAATAAASESGPQSSFQSLLTAPDRMEPGERLAAQLVLTNPSDAPASCVVSYSLQVDSVMFGGEPPDPHFGSDHALGARSWTEADGKAIEEGSLTDGKDYTDAETPWVRDHFSEALQYVDLGQTRKITRISYLSGDANHSWKLDVAASPDGVAYTPIPELQGIDTFKKWGTVVLPLRGPVETRYLRLRHHHDGAKESIIRMPCRLSVYDGADDESWDLPNVGEIVGERRTVVEIGGRASEVVDLTVDRPLEPGAYLLAARLECGQWRQLAYHRLLVLPKALEKVTAESRFGINGANGDFAPLIRRLGVGWVRFENLKWPFVSPEPGVYRFDGTVKPWVVNHDAIFKAYANAGLNVLPFLFMTASYASSAPPGVEPNRRSFYPPKDPEQFAEFAFQVAARYGTRPHEASALKTADGVSGLGYLRVYEIWNEPNLTDPGWGPWVGTSEQYLELLRAAAEAVKRADPSAKVTNAGYAGIQVKTVDPLQAHTYADGKRPLDFVDILNVHFYSGRTAPEIATADFNANQSGETTAEEDFRRLAAWRDRNKPGMPIWLTETGYDSAGPYGTDERTQAARLPRVIMLALANGIDKVFVYRESGSQPSMHAASGLLRDDGAMKPSWQTYATLVRQLDGVEGRATRLPCKDDNCRLYAWQTGAQTILTAWNVEGETKLDISLGRATITDAFGHERRIDLNSGLPLSIFPVYIRDFTEPQAVEALLGRARAQEIQRQEQHRRLAQAEAYLFNFGGEVPGVTLDVGRERPYQAVRAADVYSEQKGFGFSPGPAAEDQNRAWIRSDLDRTACKLMKGHEFRFRAKAARYTLRLGVSPYGDARVTIRGAGGGEKILDAAKGDVVVETTLDATGGPVSISVDNYANLRWLAVVEQLSDE